MKSVPHFCQFFVRCEVSLPHFRPVLAANDLKFSFCTSALPGLLKIWSFAAAIPLYLYCQRSEVPLFILPLGQDFEDLVHFPHFRISFLPGLPKMWSSGSARLLCLDCQRSEVERSILPLDQGFKRSRSSSTLVLPGVLSMGKSTSAFHLCRDFKRCEVPLPHSALTANDVKFSFHTSALPGLLKVWSFASAIPLCLYCQRSEVPLYRPRLRRSRSSSALVLPGLPNMDKATSAFHLCRDFQRCEVPLPHFCSALTAKDLKFRSVFPLGQDFERSRSSSALVLSWLAHFISAGTSKDLKFRFCTSALPWLPKMWNFASSVPPYVKIFTCIR